MQSKNLQLWFTAKRVFDKTYTWKYSFVEQCQKQSFATKALMLTYSLDIRQRGNTFLLNLRLLFVDEFFQVSSPFFMQFALFKINASLTF